MTDYPTVGIGILNWNGKKYLEQFLPSVERISYPNFKIYVIDNASSDGSVEWLRFQHPLVEIIETGGNYGVAGGYNRAFSQMEEPLVLMLNSDVEVESEFLEPLVAQMLNNPALAVCQSKLLAFDRRYQFEYGGAAGGMMDVLGYSFCRGRVLDTIENDEGQYLSGNIFWAGGACCLIQREVYERIGGMYEYFFMHFEEIDLCWRMYTNGYEVGYCNESVAYHVGGGTLSYQSPTKTYYNFRNNLIMVWRNSPWYFLLWWVPLRFFFDAAATIQYIIKNDKPNALAVLKSYFGWLAWLFKEKNKWPVTTRSLLRISIVLKKSILWQYLVRNQKSYQTIF